MIFTISTGVVKINIWGVLLLFKHWKFLAQPNNLFNKNEVRLNSGIANFKGLVKIMLHTEVLSIAKI